MFQCKRIHSRRVVVRGRQEVHLRSWEVRQKIIQDQVLKMNSNNKWRTLKSNYKRKQWLPNKCMKTNQTKLTVNLIIGQKTIISQLLAFVLQGVRVQVKQLLSLNFSWCWHKWVSECYWCLRQQQWWKKEERWSLRKKCDSQTLWSSKWIWWTFKWHLKIFSSKSRKHLTHTP